ncbi:hypothetical protein N7541_009325 [Penicillium brevicompactum]|uniref:Uncharacterized protein n=1 Tax=Penicillium brevicompactum TaxID=5074 RepID=A0A9W9QLF3_PENBR|nr:uncharacterized protein N7506_005560 [Penicillium brevicompactum]KAJ5337538.1 hypothetical protein N7506_005560 [Penicillium brevicompactum]KAJ5340201.1 hypothetical protein N7541_009325 [Penicillium brevicompactum]
MVQDKVSEHAKIVGVAERLDTLLLDCKDLNSEQWGSVENEAIIAVFSLLYCCIMECYELKPTPLAISSMGVLGIWTTGDGQRDDMKHTGPVVYHSRALLDL